MHKTISNNASALDIKKIGRELPRFFLLIATLVVACIFGLLQPKFFNITNILNILCTASLIGILAMGVVFAMASGEINFAVGSQATLAAATVGAIMDAEVMPYAIAVIIGILFSMLIGAIAITMVNKIGVPSFIATLSLSTFSMGLVKLITDNKVMFSTNWNEDFTFLGRGYIGPFPVILIVFMCVISSALIIVDKTPLGRKIFSVGTNKTACKQVGIDVKRIKLIAFLLSSAFAGFVGVLAAARDFNIRPTLGSELMMTAMASAMLGATFLRPGRFNVQGTVIAAVLTVMIQNGMVSIGAPIAYRYLVQGLIFLFSVGFIALTRKDGLPGIKFGK